MASPSSPIIAVATPFLAAAVAAGGLLLLAAAAALVASLLGRLGEARRQAADAAAEAARLRDRLGSESLRRAEADATLASMSDAMIAVDTGGAVLRINRSAGRLLLVAPDAARGRPLTEVARDPAISALFADTLDRRAVDDRELKLAVADQPLDRPRRLSARTAVLHDEAGARIGAIAVLRDVTELRRLEGVRKDFVANVSHELKTPIAAMKAAVETLLDGADETPADRLRFLRMAARQAERLDAIIEDLLTLARLEGSPRRLELAAEWVGPILAAAADACAPAAEEAGVRVVVNCEPGLLALVQPNLAEQAVVNLLDNAIKYGPAGGTVRVDAGPGASPGSTAIRVHNGGPGIPEDHLARLFERFYRVDPSRSRSGGGTGLGLSIVRHVAEACGGGVAVASPPGEGTTFTLTLLGPPEPAGAEEAAVAKKTDPGGEAPRDEPAAPARARLGSLASLLTPSIVLVLALPFPTDLL
ncbi:sensor histidine kinase [Phycisphaera mikurensis]|uniref:histidine kinase n=1 Tax=Phycisphaera mikurensis (strain NBRC 102666 / KCTC 22515 / FYK2301M01) TaxID=1142394 RepID=I0IHZ7_PHYMF|nr:ATP-binding protein [Phycisphaera mikurensis]MBB6442551.1 two-component system phosphate regulon sensor histidine kinase PhoR [Phycisphaera mikurensis]BAM04885.1 two-component system sensor histidine kinase [Phycisphaera mikurensis NBRC 102666]